MWAGRGGAGRWARPRATQPQLRYLCLVAGRVHRACSTRFAVHRHVHCPYTVGAAHAQQYGTQLDNTGTLPACRSRAQGFPDHFRFAGDMPHRYRQVGNAVPPPLARALGEELAKATRAGPGAKTGSEAGAGAGAGVGAAWAEEEAAMAAGAVEVDG